MYTEITGSSTYQGKYVQNNLLKLLNLSEENSFKREIGLLSDRKRAGKKFKPEK